MIEPSRKQQHPEQADGQNARSYTSQLKVPARVSRLPGQAGACLLVLLMLIRRSLQVGVYEYSPVRLREEAVDWQ